MSKKKKTYAPGDIYIDTHHDEGMRLGMFVLLSGPVSLDSKVVCDHFRTEARYGRPTNAIGGVMDDNTRSAVFVWWIIKPESMEVAPAKDVVCVSSLTKRFPLWTCVYKAKGAL